jgi:hypothetical protein
MDGSADVGWGDGNVSGNALSAIVINPDEWARAGGCKPDTLTATVNRISLLNHAGGVTLCKAVKMQDMWARS